MDTITLTDDVVAIQLCAPSRGHDWTVTTFEGEIHWTCRRCPIDGGTLRPRRPTTPTATSGD